MTIWTIFLKGVSAITSFYYRKHIYENTSLMLLFESGLWSIRGVTALKFFRSPKTTWLGPLELGSPALPWFHWTPQISMAEVKREERVVVAIPLFLFGHVHVCKVHGITNTPLLFTHPVFLSIMDVLHCNFYKEKYDALWE